MTALGVDVAYPELDIRFETPVTPAKLAVQADVFAAVAGSCVDTKRCVGITVWGVRDPVSCSILMCCLIAGC